MSITLFRCWGLSRQMNEGCKACYKTSSKWRTSSPTEMIYVITMLYVSFEICSVAYTPWTVLHLIVCILQHGFYVYMTILTPQPPLSLLLSSQQFSTFLLITFSRRGNYKDYGSPPGSITSTSLAIHFLFCSHFHCNLPFT